MTKYLEKRQKADGAVFWAFNPNQSVRKALGYKYKSFQNKRDAELMCRQVAAEFNLYQRKKAQNVKVDEESVLGLINFYKTTYEWQKLAENSKIHYNLLFRTATEFSVGNANKTFGELDAQSITATKADALYTQILKAFSPHRAVHVVKVLRKVWNEGFRHDRVRANPFSNMRIPDLPARTVLWEPEQVHTLISKADEMGFPSIGTLTLLCYDLCSRPGDMRQLTWGSYDGIYMEYIQEKTKTRLSVLTSPRLNARLGPLKDSAIGGEKAPEDHIIIAETTGKPYTKDHLVKCFARIRRQAGLPTHLQLRDLRRTGATEMAESGCTEDELRAVTGHQSREILATYVRPTTKLATSAVNKRFG